MDLNGALTFVRVVQLGSFTKAARALGLPNSTVSDRISDLEEALGVRLITRTTRKLHLTDAGSIFFGKAEAALAALIDAGEEASSLQKHPAGVLKITAPVELPLSSISEAVLEYMEKFPNVKVHFLLTDRVVDLVGEGVDIAIRPGSAGPSSLSSTLLGSGGFILVASPEYLAKSPKIRQPSDLESHKCLVISAENSTEGTSAWSLMASGDRKARIEPQARLSSNSVGAIRYLASIGEGVALIPPLLAHEDIAKGRVIQVLPEWSAAPQPIYLLHTDHRNSSPKVREILRLIEPPLRRAVQGPSGS